MKDPNTLCFDLLNELLNIGLGEYISGVGIEKNNDIENIIVILSKALPQDKTLPTVYQGLNVKSLVAGETKFCGETIRDENDNFFDVVDTLVSKQINLEAGTICGKKIIKR